MTAQHDKYEELLSQLPEYRRGDISPMTAHQITALLEDDEVFAREAAREELVMEALGAMRPDPIPRGLIAKSVKNAVGDAGYSPWFSVDTLLVALGVGVGCAAAAQFLSGRIELMPTIGEWIGSLAGMAVEGPLSTMLGAAVIASGAVILGGVAWAVRLVRNS